MRMHLLEQRDGDVEVELTDDGPIIDRAGFEAATGWELRPEGMCRGPVCVPIAGAGVVEQDRVDLSAFVDRLGQTVVVDAGRGVVAVGGDPMARGRVGALQDVVLPGLDGGLLDFGDLTGRKTLLIAWASW